MELCYFCDLASGKEQRVHIAFEDDLAIAVLATEPVNPGQLVILPRAHVATLEEMGDENVARFFDTTRRLIRAIRKAGIKCEGTELHLSEGPTSGLPHFLMQLLPRFEGDWLWTRERLSWNRSHGRETPGPLWWQEFAARQFGDAWLPKRNVTDEELRDVAARIRKAYWSEWGSDPAAGLALTRRS